MYNHELDKEFNSPNSLNVTKTSRLRYAGHMIRKPEDLSQKAKPNGRRNQGRLKYRWEDGVNSDCLVLGVRDWTHCAQDRQTWRLPWRDYHVFNRPLPGIGCSAT
jgi:hypothetical protein